MLRTARLYPLSAAENPPKMEWFNASGKTANATFPIRLPLFRSTGQAFDR